MIFKLGYLSLIWDIRGMSQKPQKIPLGYPAPGHIPGLSLRYPIDIPKQAIGGVGISDVALARGLGNSFSLLSQPAPHPLIFRGRAQATLTGSIPHLTSLVKRFDSKSQTRAVRSRFPGRRTRSRPLGPSQAVSSTSNHDGGQGN